MRGSSLPRLEKLIRAKRGDLMNNLNVDDDSALICT